MTLKHLVGAGLIVAATLTRLDLLGQTPATPPAAPEPGIYVSVPHTSGGDELIKLHGSAIKVQQHANMAKMMLLGHAPSMSGELLGLAADYRISNPSPTFVFFLSQGDGRGSAPASTDPTTAWAQMMGQDRSALDAPPAIAKSADEFLLVQFNIKDETRVADLGPMGKPEKSKDAVAKVVERVAHGVYRLRAKSDLKPGEYGFVFAGSAASPRVFWDFGLDAKK
jgi:hypothetical protein